MRGLRLVVTLGVVAWLAAPADARPHKPRPHPIAPAPKPVELDEAALATFKTATDHYAAARYDEAAKLFEELYVRFPEKPVLLFNLGQAHRLLRHTERAIFFYKRYLANSPNAENRTDVEAKLTALEAERQRELAAPPPVVATPAAATSSNAIVTAPPARRPVYKKWWFWTAIVGGAAVVGGAVAAGVILSQRGSFSSPYPDFGPGVKTMQNALVRF